MATTTVKKGTNRPAHYARRNKHAQRTPLPPRAVTKNMTAVLIREEMNRMAATPTAAQQKALAAIDNNSTVVVHPKVAAALVEHKWARHLKDGRWKVTATGKRYANGYAASDAARTGAESPAPAPETKKRSGKPVGPHSAPVADGLGRMSARFVAAARESGWAVEVSHPRPGLDKLTATREDEVVYCAQANDKLDVSDPPYTVIAGRKVRLRQLSACIKQMTLPDDERPVRRELRQSVVRHREETDDRPVREALPFSDDSSDEDIISSVLGRTVTWRNSVSGNRQSQDVTAHAKHVRIDNHPVGRILTFNGVEHIVSNGKPVEAMTGTFSIYVHRILKVK